MMSFLTNGRARALLALSFNPFQIWFECIHGCLLFYNILLFTILGS